LSFVHQLRSEPGEFALLVMGKTVNEQVAHREIQGGIAKELQAFVVAHVELRVLMDVRPVQQRVDKELPVAKTIL
jgi:hypothetical protein